MTNLVSDLNWRYAVKSFDNSKPLADATLNEILEAVRLAPSSFGMQPYKVLVITNPEIRKQLREHSWNQTQITDASALIVLCSYTSFTEKNMNDMLQLMATTRNIPVEALNDYKAMIEGSIVKGMSTAEQLQWIEKQTYLALGVLITACAALHVDACPMEGFARTAYDQLLNLTAQGLTSTVVATVGYRSNSDQYQHLTKVRQLNSSFVQYIK